MIICNEIEEAQNVAKYLEKKNISFELVKEMESNCEYLKSRIIH